MSQQINPTPPTPESNIVTYDFSKPSGLSSEISEQWSSWLDAFIGDFKEKWLQIARSEIDIQIRQNVALTFDSARRRIPKPSLAYEISLGSAPIATLLVLPRNLALGMILQLLGENLDGPPEDRSLSAVEHSLGEMLFHQFTNSIGESWPQKETLTCHPTKLDLMPHRSRMFDPRTVTIVCHFFVDFGAEGLECMWILPQKELEKLLLETDTDQVELTEASKKQMERRVLAIPIDITVRLGEVDVPVSRLANLNTGDVIVLDQRINETLPLVVANKIKFLGWLGRLGNRQAFKIAEIA